MKSYKLQFSVTVQAPQYEVYQCAFAYDLLKAFESLPFLPGFLAHVFDRKASTAGCERWLYVEDMLAVRQELVSYDPGNSFLVRLSDFNRLRLYGIISLDYQFCFYSLSEKATLMRCEYTFLIRTPLWDFLFRRYVQKKMQEHIGLFLTAMSKKISC